MKKLKINIWTGIYNIFACVIFASSWFVIFSTAFSDAANKTNATGGAATFFYAESLGTTTYKSTMGGKITVPLALAKKIDDAGTAPDDYGD